MEKLSALYTTYRWMLSTAEVVLPNGNLSQDHIRMGLDTKVTT